MRQTFGYTLFSAWGIQATFDLDLIVLDFRFYYANSEFPLALAKYCIGIIYVN